jgi:hypothetical protein
VLDGSERDTYGGLYPVPEGPSSSWSAGPKKFFKETTDVSMTHTGILKKPGCEKRSLAEIEAMS